MEAATTEVAASPAGRVCFTDVPFVLRQPELGRDLGLVDLAGREQRPGPHGLALRDEEMALRDEEVTGELPPDLEYEEFNEIREQLAAMIEEQLAVYKTRQAPLDLGLVVRDYLAQYPRARHFDVARIVVDQAVRLGIAQADFTGLPPKWQPINDYGAKVQAHVIDKY